MSQPAEAASGIGSARSPLVAQRFTPPQPAVPLPPNLHWGLCILINLVSCGLFGTVWSFIQANWAKKIRPDNPAMVFLAGYVAAFFVAIVLSTSESTENVGTFVNLGGVVMFVIAQFKVRRAMEDYFNTEEPIHLVLSGVMTFFFGWIYLQYHFNRIYDWKRTGYLKP